MPAQCLECPGCCAHICAGPCTFPYGGYASPSGRAFLDANATESHLDMCDFSTLLELLDGACAGLKRKCASGDVSSGAKAPFSVGAFVQGGLGGVLKCTRAFPWTVRLLVAGCCARLLLQSQIQRCLAASQHVHGTAYRLTQCKRVPKFGSALFSLGGWWHLDGGGYASEHAGRCLNSG